MLKKLSKYGNSTTLVIDKAILELLNMDESSMVKLATDGKSLIVTPVSSTTKEKVSYAPEEAMQAAVHASAAKQQEKLKVTQERMNELTPGMQEEFKAVFGKHRDLMQKVGPAMANNEEWKAALAMLAQKYDPVAQAEDYVKELNMLKIQFFPELGELDKELQAIALKYEALSKN